MRISLLASDNVNLLCSIMFWLLVAFVTPGSLIASAVEPFHNPRSVLRNGTWITLRILRLESSILRDLSICDI